MKILSSGIAGNRRQALKDIPGSKTVMVALAWGFVTAMLPAIAAGRLLEWQTAIIMIWAAGLVFVRTAFFDMLDIQGDQIVGNETLPGVLGEKKSGKLLKSILVFIAALFMVNGLLVSDARLMLPLAAVPVFMLVLLCVHEKKEKLPGIWQPLTMESFFVLAGIFALFADI